MTEDRYDKLIRAIGVNSLVLRDIQIELRNLWKLKILEMVNNAHNKEAMKKNLQAIFSEKEQQCLKKVLYS